ncbi:MAG: hypothetical protein QOI85_2105 [Chloroflexota bacterium]|jgi:hypothetical protein|nr:hypothetical protein [Chloroflexota bacterium]
MESNLPATRDDTTVVPVEAAPVGRRQPLSVAFLPFALIVFIVLALSIAAWTFLAATP